MKFARFRSKTNEEHSGVVHGNEVQEIKGDMFGEWTYTGATFSVNEVQWLAPVIPNEIIGIGANYIATETNRPESLPDIPVFFYKPKASVIGTEQSILIPQDLKQVKFESELVVVIGQEADHIEEHEVQDHIFGYTVGNDVTAPDYFREDGHWMVGKSFQTFTPLGPVIHTDIDPSSIRVQAYHNGQIKQDGTLELMIVSVEKMISYLSKVFPLQPGDVILTGAPVGADFMQEGDIIECVIEGIGTLRNTVRS